MSRIGDDNSDNQRIAEMQEAELRNRVDREKRTSEKITRSFQDVMKDRAARASQSQLNAAKHQQAKQSAQSAKNKDKPTPESLLKKHLPKTGAELSRRAALSRAMQTDLARTRSADGERARALETERGDDLVKRSDEDKERVENDLRDGDAAETRKAEDLETKFKKVDPDGERQGNQDRGSRGRGGHDGRDGREQKSERIEAPEGSKQAHAPRAIPQEVIDRIVNAIHTGVTADGRTELSVDLKGPMLDGVRLKVKSEGGKVHCTFEGCDKELKNLLESSKGALMRGLSRRGLTLASLKVS